MMEPLHGKPRLLSEDAAHYNEAYKVFLDRNNMQEAKLEIVKRFVPVAVQHACSSKGTAGCTSKDVSSVLGIGSSGGDIDISILEAIIRGSSEMSEKITIYNRAVEPNSEAIASFESRAGRWKEINSEEREINFDFVQATFQEYQSKIKHDFNRYQLIHFIGCIYYVDPEDALRHCLEKELAENGVIMVACLADDSFLAHYTVKFHDSGVCPYPAPGFVLITSNYIREIAERNKWYNEYHEVDWYQYVTEVANDTASRESQMLIDFTTRTIDFEAVKGKEMALKVKEFFMEESQSKEDGRRVIGNKYGVVLIYRSPPTKSSNKKI